MTCFFARGKDAWWCLRINGVVEDSGEGVVDVADHVIQLVLGLQSQWVGSLVCIDDNLRCMDMSFSTAILKQYTAVRDKVTGKKHPHLVLWVGVHCSDF